MPSLAQAILAKDLSLVKQCLAHGADINQIDEYGFTPLIEAAIANDVAISEFLLQQGADVAQQDLVGGTALHWAVENNNVALVNLLLNKGADPNAYNNNGEPILIKPMLRQQGELKNLLIDKGAATTFALDYLNAKLLGHRYELRGSVDIVSAAGNFVEVGMEGFFLEFSLNLVRYSLQQFTKNFAARAQQTAFPILKQVVEALQRAAELMQLTQYQTNLAQHTARINALLQQELLVIPTAYAGHAITFVRYRDWWVRCDRRKIDETLNGITVFKVTKPHALSVDFMRHLIYDKKPAEFIERDMVDLLGLTLVSRVLISPQMSGNCSWANVVASVPAIYYLLTLGDAAPEPVVDTEHPALRLYYEWRDWDRLRALQYFIQEFAVADRKRKASIASLLAAVMFQRFRYDDPAIIPTAKRILSILRQERYAYILQNYLNFYAITRPSPAGENLTKLIERCDSYL